MFLDDEGNDIGKQSPAADAADQDLVTFAAVVPEGVGFPIVVFDNNAALRAAIVDRGTARHLGDEWRSGGLYLLLGRRNATGEWGASIGTAISDLAEQATSRFCDQDDWYRALLVQRDTTYGFTSAQLDWLEGQLHDVLAAAQNVRLTNKTKPVEATLGSSEPQVLELALESIRRVLRLIGHDTSHGDDTDPAAG
ncbi:hypothetical protein [Candidatus Poriferisodalis sp.]|uniref:hypothetical protein n=1 Tax=Candidatus Poriferisodalis sp. TaxID=3101277 RepID=UPI003B01A7FF